MTTQIHSFKDSAAHFFSFSISVMRRIIQSKEGCIGIALAIILPTIYFLKSYMENISLQGRVTQLEKDVEDFWKKTADLIINHPRTTTSNVLDKQIQSSLSQLRDRVILLPTDGISEAFKKRINLLREAAFLTPKSVVEEKPVSSLNQVMEISWPDRVNQYEECVKACVSEKDSKSLEALKHDKEALFLQISEVYKYQPKPEFLECLIRIHDIARDSFPQSQVISTVKFVPFSTKFGGLARSGNNSCYLATALHLFRTVITLRDCFDPAQNKLHDPQKLEIQKIIHGMIKGMNDGKTVSAEEGKALQQLLKDVKLIDKDVYGMYDAGEIATKLLFLMGFELNSGSYSKKRISSGGESLSDKETAYNLAITVPLNATINVGQEVKEMTIKKEKIVEEVFKVGNAKVNDKVTHIDTVLSLPEFMTVEFLSSSPTLTNVAEFDDPLDSHYKYELILGMENTGGHWIAHIFCEENQWMTANDSTISKMKDESLSKINRGYYLRKPKNPEPSKVVI